MKKLKSVFPKLEWELTESQWVLLSYIALTDSCEYGTQALKSKLKLWYPTNEELRADLDVLEKNHYVKWTPTWGDRIYGGGLFLLYEGGTQCLAVLSEPSEI